MIASGTRRSTCKFLQPEWVASNKFKSANAEVERSRAEKLCSDIDVIIDDTSKLTTKVQRDVDRKLEQRVKDVEHWKNEVSDRIIKVNLEVDALEAYNVRVEKALDNLKDPLHIVHQCVNIRERRRGIELVHDDAEKELLKEIQVYSGIQTLLLRTQEQLTEQARLARKIRYKLEKDICDKDVTLDIDKQNIELKNHATLLSLKSTGTREGKRYGISSMNDWQNFSLGNILEADKVLANCENLRGIIDNILVQVAEDMEGQKTAADAALERRIAETKDTKHKLEEQLALVKSQILTTEANVDKISQAIQDKETPRKLAEARIENRAFRPNVELCMDSVQLRLFEQSHLINHSIEKLEQAAKMAMICLKGLRQQQLELEEDVNLKNETLLFDEAECQSVRRSIVLRQF